MADQKREELIKQESKKMVSDLKLSVENEVNEASASTKNEVDSDNELL